MNQDSRKNSEYVVGAQEEGRVFTPYPGADEKYEDGNDWRIYNPDKYRDPNWSPDKE
ncbi:hypothetical protein [Pseudodesulfovibrio senegalensis]|jgi:hypothetical protein|uniref:hypothetical protein n=1 Tax=Pseudodesulfovibrio senegalensis TaxID=1721087 RepID=UPI00147878F9|nr:hypothetical protein [Pseudodesulfovibrio senegalensis]